MHDPEFVLGKARLAVQNHPEILMQTGTKVLLENLLAEAEQERKKYAGRIYRPRLTDDDVWMLYNLLDKDLKDEARTLTWMRKEDRTDPGLVERHKRGLRLRQKLRLHIHFEKRSKAAQAR